MPVAIVGAGPTGITAATVLAQYGIGTLVLERWSGVYPQPRAVHLDDEVCRIIGALGVGQQFTAVSRPARGLRLLDKRHRVLAEFQRDSDLGVNGFPQANMFDQPELEALLRKNLAQYSRVELRENSEVTDLVAGERTPAKIYYFNRTNQRSYVVYADYVLGCDGANSVVRQRTGIGMQDLHFAQRWLVVDVATSADLRQWDGVQQVCNPSRAATFMRVADARYRWEFRLREGEFATDFQEPAMLMRLLAPWVDATTVDNLTVIRAAEYTFRAKIADRWRSGNVFLLGDAAHLTPPFIGQGLGSGLRDAMNLSWKLAGVIRQDLPRGVLDSYERERKPHARNLINLALLTGRLMTAGGQGGDLLRRVVLPRLSRIPGLRKKVIDSTTPSLTPSVLIARSRLGGSPLAGSLCPNPIQPDGRRLDAWLGAAFAVITTEQLSASQSATIHRRGARIITADPDTELRDWLRRGRAVAALIRPDRTVMAAAADLDGICRLVPSFYPPSAQTAFP